MFWMLTDYNANWEFISAGSVASGGNPTVSMPSGTLDNCMLIMVLTASGSGANTSSGWNRDYDASASLMLFYKSYDGSEGASVSITGGALESSAVILAYKGVCALDGASTVATASGSSPLDVSTNSVSATKTNSMVMTIYTDDATRNITSVSTPAGTTNRVAVIGTNSKADLHIYDELQTASGATSSRTITATWGAGSLTSWAKTYVFIARNGT